MDAWVNYHRDVTSEGNKIKMGSLTQRPTDSSRVERKEGLTAMTDDETWEISMRDGALSSSCKYAGRGDK